MATEAQKQEYYDLSGLTRDQLISVIVSDKLDGYSTKQIMDMYRLSFVQVAEYINEYKKTRDEIGFASLKRVI